MASTTSGVLVPRMDSSERNAIAAPTNGLLVYDTFYGSFFYYNSTKGKWVNLGAKNSGAQPNEALFAVVNNAGDTVFAVYQEGVQINVGDGLAKGTTKGGFAVSGVSSGKGTKQDYFIINQDSARIYVEEDTTGLKGTTKGGFAVSGVSSGKGIGNDIFRVTEDSVRVYFNSAPTKGTTKGGFAVSGVSSGKGTEQNYFLINQDSARIYVEEAAKGEKGTTKGGFAVSGVSSGKGISSDIMKITKDSTRLYVADPNAGFSVGNTETGSSTSLMQLLKQNYFIGHEAGININSGLYNSFIGYQAGKSSTFGSYNVFLGFQTGFANTEGANNVFIGYKCGLDNLTGTNNVFMGFQSGQMNTTGGNNVNIGNGAGAGNTTGSYNTILGYEAGSSNTSSDNTFIGYYAGKSHTIKGGNVFIGSKAGQNDINGEQSIYIGENSGFSNSTGIHNVFIGFSSGYYNEGGSENVFLGNSAGSANLSGHDNIFIGNESAKLSTSSAFNIFIGNKSGYNTTTGEYNTYIGFESGKATTTGYKNVYIGYQAGLLNETFFGNTFVGNEAGRDNTSGGNTFIGMQAGKESAASASSTYIGYNAGQSATGNFNTFIGMSSGVLCGDGTNNTYMGNLAGYNTPSGDDNVYIGKGAGQGFSTPNPGSNNVYIGKSAGLKATGSSNIFIGKDVGFDETGSNLLYIDISSTTSPLIWGDFNANDFAINGDVYINGVGAVAPFTGTANLDINGTMRLRGRLYDYNNSLGSVGNVLKRGVSGVLWADGALGTGVTSKLAFWTDANTLSSNTSFHWDNTNNRLGIGTSVPTASLNIEATSTTTVPHILIKDNASNGYGRFTIQNASGNKYWTIAGILNNTTDASSKLNFYYHNGTTGTDILSISGNGQVGIGTSPSYKLHVVDEITSNDNAAIYGYKNNTDTYGIGIKGVGGYRGVEGNASATSYNISGVYGSASGAGTGARYGVYGTATGGATAYAGYFSGDLAYTGTLTDVSDKKFKQNILPLVGTLDKLLKLIPVSYEYNSDEYPQFNLPNGQRIGLIAQDLQVVFPELVSRQIHPSLSNRNDKDSRENFIEYLGVNYIDMIPILIQSIQEQQKQIEAIKSENSEFKTMQTNFDQLKAEIEKIKAGLQMK
ncbi:MAG: tail fiber domain-containing protein [Salinivirgaceae bacterium]